MRLTVPTWITIVRLVVIVPILLLLVSGLYWWAFGLLVVALLSDWLDGFLARRWKVVSRIGAFLDHFADKVLVHVLLLYFLSLGLFPFFFLAFGILLVRDFLVLGVRHLAAQRGVEISSMSLGKIKFFGQSVLLLLLVLTFVITNSWFLILTQVVLWITVLLAFVSAVQLLFAARKVF